MTHKHLTAFAEALLPRVILTAALAGLLPASAGAQAPVYSYPSDPTPIHRYGNDPWSGGPAVGAWANPYGLQPTTANSQYPQDGPQQVPPPPPPEMEEPCDDDGWHLFTAIGYKALMRSHLNDDAFLEINDFVNPPSFGRFSDLNPEYNHGIQAAVGVHNDCYMIELTGFHVFKQRDEENYPNPGPQTQFFFNEPPGFEGIFTNPTFVQLAFETSMTNGELNFRQSFCHGPLSYQWLCGLRYVDIKEQLDMNYNTNPPDFDEPTARARYTSQTDNHLLGGQIGGGASVQLAKWLGLSAEGKAGIFANFADVDHSLVRGDGLVGFSTGLEECHFSHLYELGLFLHWYRCPCQVKIGYNAMLVAGVAEATDQVNFDLGFGLLPPPNPIGDFNGVIFYHGPSIILDITF